MKPLPRRKPEEMGTANMGGRGSGLPRTPAQSGLQGLVQVPGLRGDAPSTADTLLRHGSPKPSASGWRNPISEANPAGRCRMADESTRDCRRSGDFCLGDVADLHAHLVTALGLLDRILATAPPELFDQALLLFDDPIHSVHRTLFALDTFSESL